MNRDRAAVAVALLVGLVGVFPAAAEPPTAIPLPNGAQLLLPLPADWGETHETLGPAVNVRIVGSGATDFELFLTVLPVPPGTPESTPAEVRQLVTAVAEKKLAGAVQDRLEVVELKNPGGAGFLFHATDRQPERGAGDYREAHQGLLSVDKTMISFTVLSHSADTAIVEAALQMLGALRIQSPALPVATGGDEQRFPVPGRGWSLVFRMPGVTEHHEQSEGPRFKVEGRASGGVNFSAFVEPEGGADSAACRATYWAAGSRNPLIVRSTVELLEVGGMPAVQYVVGIEDKGRSYRAQNLNVYLAHAGTCIDFHLSTFPAASGDDARLRSIGGSLSVASE